MGVGYVDQRTKGKGNKLEEQTCLRPSSHHLACFPVSHVRVDISLAHLHLAAARSVRESCHIRCLKARLKITFRISWDSVFWFKVTFFYNIFRSSFVTQLSGSAIQFFFTSFWSSIQANSSFWHTAENVPNEKFQFVGLGRQRESLFTSEDQKAVPTLGNDQLKSIRWPTSIARSKFVSTFFRSFPCLKMEICTSDVIYSRQNSSLFIKTSTERELRLNAIGGPWPKQRIH